MVDLLGIKPLIETEFDIVVDRVEVVNESKLRVIICDGSRVTLWWSLVTAGKFSYHWDRRSVDGKVYRHDNAKHKKWEKISTYPQHFHNGSDDMTEPSYLSTDPEEGVREFMKFVHEKTIDKIEGKRGEPHGANNGS